MKTLLKDMPEHAERIENSYLLGEDIKDALCDIELDETSLGDSFKNDFISAAIKTIKESEFELDGNEIKIGNSMDIALQLFDDIIDSLQGGNITILNSGSIAIDVREKVADFVNQNYTWKGLSK